MADRDVTWNVLKALFGEDVDTDHSGLTYDFDVIRVCGLDGSMTGCYDI